MGDDVAPTSLDEGRGEMVAPALVVAFHPRLKCRLVDGWTGGGGTSRKENERRAAPMWERAKCGRSETCLVGERAVNGISLALVVPRTTRAAEVTVVCVSSVIYQNAYLIR